MKRTITLLLLMGIYGAVQAQNDLKYGVKAGLNLSSIVGKGSAEDSKMKTGYHFGVLGRTELTEILEVQAELLFSSQGVRLSDTELSPESGRRQVFNYLNIPLLVRYGINESLTLEGGPQLGFLLSAKRKWDKMEIDFPPAIPESFTDYKNTTVKTGRLQAPNSTEGATGPEPTGAGKEDIKEFVNGVYFGLSFGLDYKLPYNLSANLRYNLLEISNFYKSLP